ncbi:MAG: signal peptide peptidase SppA, partial [Myxococcales bacterium]|nr:signal peptide peptidase SppA [Myxococcales bacterium]
MRRTRVALALALAIAGGVRSDAVAQAPLEGIPTAGNDPLPTPGRALASIGDASAVGLNPANLAFLPAPELRWMWTYTGELAKVPMRGHAIDLAAPLWFLAGGLRVELHDPPGTAQGERLNHQWVRAAVAGRVDQWLGLGLGMGWGIAERNVFIDGMFGVTAAATVRPTDAVSWSLVARDFNIPTTRTNVQGLRSWETGFQFRPIAGRRDLEFGVEGAFYDQMGEGQLKTNLQFDVPFGRFRADLKWLEVGDWGAGEPQLVSTAGIDINWGPLQASGGALFGNGLGLENSGFYAGAAVRGYREPGIPLPKRVARIDINDTPGVRGHFHLLRRLWRLAKNEEIEGVLLVLKDEPSSSLAHAEELGDAIRTLRAHGKKVACHLEDAGGRSLYACSQADRIAINPAGGLRFSGFSSRYFYFGGTLDKLGVKSDFVRIGPHKSAAEQLTLSGGTQVARDDHQELVDEYEKIFVHDVGGGRQIPASTLRATLAKGPFLAKEARDAKLVDNLVYPDEIGRFMNETMGGDVSIVKSLPFSEAPKRWQSGDKVAVIYLAGDMVDGESETIPLINIRLAGSRTIAGALKRARDDASIKAVVFRMETGGGSSLAADVIWREAQLLAKKKPVVVSMGSVAASGGYYASMGGGTVYANRSTVTGSIGIFYGKVDVTGLMQKLGVGTDAARSTPRADAETLFRPFSDEEREVLTGKVKQFYDLFVGRVAEGRHMTAAEVDAVGRGRVWTGRQAKEKKLVDRVGGMREAFEEAKSLAHLPDDVAVIELPEEDDSLLGFLLKQIGFSAAGT